MAEVAIVGAGITGLTTAFFLAERGVDVVVLERSGVAAEASGVQPGGVRQQWSTRVNCLLARESVAFYRELDERLGRPVGARLDPCGYLFLAHSEAVLAEERANVALQNELGVPSRIVSAQEAAELVPGLEVDSVLGGAWCGEDGYFDRPQTVVEAFAAAAADRRVELRIEEVPPLSRDGSGWRVGSVTADAVVVAAGCSAPALVEPLGVALPIEPEARHLFLSEPIHERLVEPLVISGERRFAAKHLANGRVLASDLAAAGDPEQRREEWRRTLARGIDELLPVLSYVSFPVLASGFYDLTPDRQPVLGPVDGHEGLWLAAGFSGHGFMLAPAVARRLAAAISGDPLDPLLEPFALYRFEERAASEVERQVI